MSDRRQTERLRPGRPPGRPQQCPFVVTCPPGRYAYCRCTRSESFPYCDGSHRDLSDGDHSARDGSSDRGIPEQCAAVGPLKIEFVEPRTIAWCCCGRSRRTPFCDGSHSAP